MAPIGNQSWRARTRHGPKPIYANGEELWDDCCEYFDWVEANPLFEEKAFSGKDGIQTVDLRKMRAMTIAGLCVFLGVSYRVWSDWRQRAELVETLERVEAIIREQKFTGAAAGLLNPVIIARDLGLAERQELSGPAGGPIETKDVSARELLADRISGLAKRTGPGEGSSGPDGSAGQGTALGLAGVGEAEPTSA